MIKNVEIENFKLYSDKNSLVLKKLNLFTGINGKGKSTVLQIFLLISQSVIDNRATNRIILNGINVHLGNFIDVKSKDRQSVDQIHFGFQFDDFKLDYYLHNLTADSSELFIERIELSSADFRFELVRSDNHYILKEITNTNEEVLATNLFLFDLFLNDEIIEHHDKKVIFTKIRSALNLSNVHYVSADRIGPKNYYENKSLNHFLSVGALGENTVNILYHKGNDKVNVDVLNGYGTLFNEDPEDLSQTIEDHTNYWVDKIFQGAKVQVEAIKGEDLIKLRINSDSKSTYYKPTNVGYGFSYSLPIIVAALIAKPGEILIVENPEAHLHPHAQSIIAKLLTIVAESGVQVFVESHSEHILNGFRVAVKDSIILFNEMNVIYFHNNQDKMFEHILVDSEGGIETWPIDFFDQATSDLNYLLDI